MKILLGILISLNCWAASAEDFEFIDNGKGWTTLVYTNPNGDKYRLLLKLDELDDNEKIGKWFDEVTKHREHKSDSTN